MADRLRGTGEFLITGAEPWRFLALCAEQGIAVQDARTLDMFSVRAVLPMERLAQAERLARRSGCELKLLREHGVPGLRRRVKGRRALLAAGALLFAALCASWLFVWDISVTENDSAVSDGRILEVLSRQGVGVGSFWPDFNQERIRTRALLELPELCYLAVNVRAGRAEVEVRAAVPAPELWDPAAPGDVTADRAGVVASVTALSGKAVCVRGNAVTPGQVLIRGTERSAHARGRVTAYTCRELAAAAPLYTLKKTSAEAPLRRFAVIIGGKRINFYAESGILPTNCDRMWTITPLAVKNAFTLPVKWVTETIRPYTVSRTGADPDAVRAALEIRLAERLKQLLGERGEIIRSHFTCSDDGEILTVTLRAECLERIDTDTPRK